MASISGRPSTTQVAWPARRGGGGWCYARGGAAPTKHMGTSDSNAAATQGPHLVILTQLRRSICCAACTAQWQLGNGSKLRVRWPIMAGYVDKARPAHKAGKPQQPLKLTHPAYRAAGQTLSPKP